MADTASGKDGSAMIFIVVALLLTLVGAGTGLAVGSLLDREQAAVAGPTVEPAEASKEEEASDQESPTGQASASAADVTGDEKEHSLDGVKVVSFPPVLTTLAEPQGRWIRLEGSVQLIAETEDPPELLAERAGEQILTYLRSLRLDQLEGPSGVLGLREDLNEMVRVLSNGQVRGVLVHGLVVE